MMKIIKTEQGSEEWLNWRKTVITATDCPAILGSSPYQTAHKCWQRKLGLVEPQKTSAIMERGKALEPIARAQFEVDFGIKMIPEVVESTEHPFLGASLDGISPCGQYILEIKTGGDKQCAVAELGEIPDHYMHQMQHQLLVTGAKLCYYYFFDGSRGICLEVEPDPQFVAMFLPIARDFWRKIAFFEAPQLTERDYKDMNDDKSWNEYADMYLEVDAQLKGLEDKKDFLRKKLIELAGEHNCQSKALKVMKIITRGRVDYEQVPELKTVDLDKYRKGTSVSWKIVAAKAG